MQNRKLMILRLFFMRQIKPAWSIWTSKQARVRSQSLLTKSLLQREREKRFQSRIFLPTFNMFSRLSWSSSSSFLPSNSLSLGSSLSPPPLQASDCQIAVQKIDTDTDIEKDNKAFFNSQSSIFSRYLHILTTAFSSSCSCCCCSPSSTSSSCSRSSLPANQSHSIHKTQKPQDTHRFPSPPPPAPTTSTSKDT